MTWIINPPPVFELPVSKGGDLKADFVYKPLVVDGDGEPVLDIDGNRQYEITDYPVGATVKLVIDTSTPTIGTAVITDAHAVILIDRVACDTVDDYTLWRCVLTYSDGYDQVICNGQVIRSDGVPA